VTKTFNQNQNTKKMRMRRSNRLQSW